MLPRSHDPLGREVEASFGLLPDGSTAVVEAAQASGLGRVAEAERDAFAASSAGTGELIAAACEAGASHVLVAVGGSATTDGGAGALEALREAGVEPRLSVSATCARRGRTRRGCSARRRAPTPAPSSGSSAVSRSWPPRRPATRAAFRCRAQRAGSPAACGPGSEPSSCPARPTCSTPLGFDERMREATFVVTGEGSLDEQTLAGKVCGEVATRCRQRGVACHAVVGRNELDPFEERIIDLASVTEATTLAELETAGRALVAPG